MRERLRRYLIINALALFVGLSIGGMYVAVREAYQYLAEVERSLNEIRSTEDFNFRQVKALLEHETVGLKLLNEGSIGSVSGSNGLVGTFFVVNKNGKNLAMSAKHVCRLITNVVTIIKESKTTDLCVFTLPGIDTHAYLPVAQVAPFGTKVLSIGYPAGYLHVYYGHLLHKNYKAVHAAGPDAGIIFDGRELSSGRSMRSLRQAVSFFGVLGGASGSPVVDMDGKVVGVVVESGNRPVMGSIVPLESIIQFLESVHV